MSKRLRIFAGPNGSGKSTLVDLISNLKINLGVYVNADEINKTLIENNGIDFGNYGLQLNFEDLTESLIKTSFYTLVEGLEIIRSLTFQNDNCLNIINEVETEKFSSFLSDYIRFQLLKDNCERISFETVMSHPSKLDFIKTAKANGYKVYLYFVSLENPIMNVERVNARVQLGGHDVPEDKIISRYKRTMELLLDAIKLVDRAYFFDNSSERMRFFAKYQNKEVLYEDEFIPVWFNDYVENKYSNNINVE
ncbi:MAG TPA: zeta toxin family protein [Paludibacter sp.]